MNRWLLVLLLVVGCGTGGKSDNDDEIVQLPSTPSTPGTPAPPPPPPPPPAGGTTTDLPTVPRTAAAPVGVTWHIGVTENVSRQRLEAIYASWIATNNALWNISEGQVRCHKLVISDNVGPGVRATQFMFGGGFNASGYDILVWPAAQWDIQASGAVSDQPGQGRAGRLMVIPENAKSFVRLHEASHLLFHLTWSPGGLLVDEYRDGVQDQACVMESENLPQRWCSSANHQHQTSQPHACWQQLLADYPNFRYTGTNTAPALPPAPQVTYIDTP